MSAETMTLLSPARQHMCCDACREYHKLGHIHSEAMIKTQAVATLAEMQAGSHRLQHWWNCSHQLTRESGGPCIKLGSHSLMYLKAGQPQRSVHLLKIHTLETSSHALIATGMYYTSMSNHSEWLQTGHKACCRGSPRLLEVVRATTALP
ncbi:hypothetical protein WJX77_009358 [Trebouxia sp. C0004]